MDSDALTPFDEKDARFHDFAILNCAAISMRVQVSFSNDDLFPQGRFPVVGLLDRMLDLLLVLFFFF